MPKLKFNDIAVKRLTVPATGRVDYWDTLLPGFGCRINESGTKTWVVNVRTLNEGKWSATKRIRVGRYPDMTLIDARKAASAAMQAARTGQDPGQVARRNKEEIESASRDIFKNAVGNFLQMYVAEKRLSTQRQYRTALLGPDVANWQNRPISSITRSDIRDKLAEIARTRPILANRSLAYWSVFFGWCVEQDKIEINPTSGVRKPSAERSRERVLTFEEIAEILAALRPDSIPHQMFRLLLLTGQRRDEIGSLKWSEIHGLDGAEPRIELPGARTKNHRPHIIPLSNSAAEIIKSAPRIRGCEYVFSTTGKTPISGYSRAKSALDKSISTDRKQAGQKDLQAWTLHDLRRTFATHAHESLGVEPHVVEAILNHLSGSKAGVAGVYNRATYLPQRRAALQAWAYRLSTLMPMACTRSSTERVEMPWT
ncbi:MAG: site-specific integrase [Alphaproteobacteria bacterium]|nr:site-specific integrase [Alphaproteobacteria bacterium]